MPKSGLYHILHFFAEAPGVPLALFEVNAQDGDQSEEAPRQEHGPSHLVQVGRLDDRGVDGWSDGLENRLHKSVKATVLPCLPLWYEGDEGGPRE